MAGLAGRVGEGICVPVGPTMQELLAVARSACTEAGRDPGRLLVVASLSAWSPLARLTVETGVDRLIVYVAPPFSEGLARLSEAVRTGALPREGRLEVDRRYPATGPTRGLTSAAL